MRFGVAVTAFVGLFILVMVPKYTTQSTLMVATGAAADAMCNPVYPECPCGKDPDPKKPGTCKAGGNKFMCPKYCIDITNGHVAARGECIAPNKCKASECGGKACEQDKGKPPEMPKPPEPPKGGGGDKPPPPPCAAPGTAAGGDTTSPMVRKANEATSTPAATSTPPCPSDSGSGSGQQFGSITPDQFTAASAGTGGSTDTNSVFSDALSGLQNSGSLNNTSSGFSGTALGNSINSVSSGADTSEQDTSGSTNANEPGSSATGFGSPGNNSQNNPTFVDRTASVVQDAYAYAANFLNSFAGNPTDSTLQNTGSASDEKVSPAHVPTISTESIPEPNILPDSDSFNAAIRNALMRASLIPDIQSGPPSQSIIINPATGLTEVPIVQHMAFRPSPPPPPQTPEAPAPTPTFMQYIVNTISDTMGSIWSTIKSWFI
ncbi:MAG: hypothetical protein Q8R25_01755 [bacterium]|nr:hypothetical protein [bacterium]